MPDDVRFLYLNDGLELVASENETGLALESYKVRLSGKGLLAVRSERKEPSPTFRGRRFASMDELVAALRRELGQ